MGEALRRAWGRWSRLALTTKILIGMAAGVGLGLAAGPHAEALRPLGLAFLRLLAMMILPLVFASLALGVGRLGDVRALGRIGIKTLAYYVGTTVLAVTIGLALANLVAPGEWLDAESRARLLASAGAAVDPARIAELREHTGVGQILLDAIPSNIFASMAEGAMVPVILFALFFGAALAAIGRERGGRVADLLDGVNEAALWMIGAVMRLAPLGVLFLMASVVGPLGAGILASLAVYAVVVLGGLGLHVGVSYPLLVWWLARRGPARFFRAVRPAQVVAFSTSSSAATLPTTMACARDRLGVPDELGAFCLPLGATINMDGTALYQAVATLFVAQVYGIPLDVEAQGTIVLTATLASIGTAAVPGAGVVMLAMILTSVGVPSEGIGMILGVDRLLDMCRTAVNVTGDLAGAVIVARSEGRLREPADG
ncbi:MAG: dicarboxylate/amino acid:cation symporter [Myxococcales bacterium]|nr:dicarboxylate/amino acid:cation symporter [Myxococcales bacterium]